MRQPQKTQDEMADLQERLRDSNVNEHSFLATDYLNHFNEILMLIEMLPEMPEMAEELFEWQPKSYEQHFLDSGLPEAGLAIEAYSHCLPDHRETFDLLVSILDESILQLMGRIKAIAGADAESAYKRLIPDAVAEMHETLNQINAVINARGNGLDQDHIDQLIDSDF